MHRVHKITLGLIGAAAVISMAILSLTNVQNSFSVTTTSTGGTSCSGVLMSRVNSTSDSKLNGTETFHVSIPTSIPAKQVIFHANNTSGASMLLGRALPKSLDSASSSTTIWEFLWDTTLWPGSTGNSVKLIATINNGTSACEVATTNYYYIYPPTYTVNLGIAADPASINIPAGNDNSQEINVRSSINKPTNATSNSVTADSNIYGIFKWSTATNIGSISPKSSDFLSSNGVVYKPGLTAGSNNVTASIYYGGSHTTVTVPITVKTSTTVPPVGASSSSSSSRSTSPTSNSSSSDSSTSSSSSSNNSPDTTNATSTPTTTSEMATTNQITSSQIQVSSIAQNCIEEAITEKRYDAIENGSSRPTTNELSKTTSCFATSNYVMPSHFSPIDPAKIDEVTAGKLATVSKLKNLTKTTTANSTKEVIKITGKAQPNNVVLIYIFSDPLIITAKTDSNGEWQYVLENPLEPGKHEVYAVVDRGDGAYTRSDPTSFFIGTASATAANPNGLSLALGKSPVETPSKSNNGLIFYIVGAAIILIAAISGLFIALHIRKKHTIASGSINNSPTPTLTGPDATTPTETQPSTTNTFSTSALVVPPNTNNNENNSVTPTENMPNNITPSNQSVDGQSFNNESSQEQTNNRGL